MAKKQRVMDDEEELDEAGLDDAQDDGLPPAARAPRRTLGQMAAGASATADGVRCPACGCGHSRVAYTYDVDGGRRRKRLCRHCGREFVTLER